MPTYTPNFDLIELFSPVAFVGSIDEQGVKQIQDLAVSVTDEEQADLVGLMGKYEVPQNYIAEVVWYYSIGKQKAKATNPKRVGELIEEYGKEAIKKAPKQSKKAKSTEPKTVEEYGREAIKEAYQQTKKAAKECEALKQLSNLNYAQFRDKKGEKITVESEEVLRWIAQTLAEATGKLDPSALISPKTKNLSDLYWLYAEGKSNTQIADTEPYIDKQDFATKLYQFLLFKTTISDKQRYHFGAGLMEKAGFVFPCQIDPKNPKRAQEIFDLFPEKYAEHFRHLVKSDDLTSYTKEQLQVF